MEKQKNLSCQKYYIFKIRDIVNNSFHTLEEKRFECLIQYLDLCISTYDEYRMAIDSGKLKKAYENLLEGLSFQMQNHPFNKMDLYRSDFAYLRKLILLSEDQRNKELHNIHRDIVSLRRKLSSGHLIDHYIMCINEIDNFKRMDNLMEALISDLLYMGYSLSYLMDWFKNNKMSL